MSDSVNSWITARKAPLSFSWVSDAIQPSHSLLPLSPPALNLSQHQTLFQRVSSLHQMAKILALQHQSFQWISGLISFRIDWFDLLAVQGTLKSLLQHRVSKASILQCSAFFMVQLSYPYMTTGKTIALVSWTVVGKVMSLIFNLLSRFVWGLPSTGITPNIDLCSKHLKSTAKSQMFY